MQSRFQLALDALALLLSKATFIGLRLLFLYMAATRLDSAAFGALALGFTTAEICRYIGDWGTDTWALRQFSDPNALFAATHMRWVMRVRIVSTVVAGMLAWFAVGLLAPQPTAFQHAAIALTAATSLWLNLGVNWLQARAALRPVAGLLSVAGAACSVALVVGQIHNNAIEQQMFTLVISELVMTVGVMLLAQRHLKNNNTSNENKTFTPIRLAHWWKAVTPIALAALIALAYGRLDQYFVSETADPTVLGDYTLAQRIVEPVLFVLVALTSTIYVRASAFVLSHGVGPATRQYAWRWVRLIGSAAVMISLIIGTAFTLLGPQWLPQYARVTPFLWIALLCTVFRCMNLCLTAFIQAMGAYGHMFRISVINALTITTGVLTAGISFGPVGAAIGVCAGEAINTIIQSLTLKKLLLKETIK